MALSGKVLAIDALEKAAAELRSKLHKAMMVEGQAPPDSGGKRYPIRAKMKEEMPAASSGTEQAAFVLSLWQTNFMRKEIMLWLTDHSMAGTSQVDWSCITVKNMLELVPEICSDLEPLYSRTVEERRVRALLQARGEIHVAGGWATSGRAVRPDTHW